ncbi:hypothetical protein [Flavobacterium sp. NRK1]|uniref:hypothetical protein n=1 Tax=Flavobacterium sp. NRK1 TaxID=2954929 RepID=UPI002091FD91|nr:hypothetical protein [Flavobacterium sp. NRK1]MCO6146626.1 hypothetical protein [Flavobacterium sp. NRK1]
MKTKLLLAFMATFLISCSGEDDTITVEADPHQVVEKKLDYVVKTTEADSTIIQFNDNNQIINETRYDLSGVIDYKKEYIYDFSGHLKTVKDFYAFYGLDQPVETQSYSYDDEGKLIKRIINEKQSTYDLITRVIYSYSNTVISYEVTSNTSNNTGHGTYLLNNEGFISKIEGNYTDEFLYEGDNIIWFGGTRHLPSDIYEYDMINEPVGPYVHMYKNPYGSINNAILMTSTLYVSLLGSNYVTKWYNNDNNFSYEVKYEFDDDGYPVKVKRYYAGIPDPLRVEEIFYK